MSSLVLRDSALWRRYNASMAEMDSQGRLLQPIVVKGSSACKNKTKKCCLDFVKLLEVDSRLSIKCTCHQTSAKVKYSSQYVHDCICSRCTATAGYETFMITVLWCQNVNIIWWTARWWGNSPHPYAAKNTSPVCHAGMWQQRLWMVK